MKNDGSYTKEFLKSINTLTGISIKKIEKYVEENSPLNILEHPNTLDLTERQFQKINVLNELISTYQVVKMKEEEQTIKFQSSNQSGNYFLSLLRGKKEKEHFLATFLGNGNKVIETNTISTGTIESSLVDPRTVLKMALANDCKGIIIAHNHPGGNIKPSFNDIKITERFLSIFKPLGINVLDHIIVAGNKYLSMAEDGYISKMEVEDANYDIIHIGNDELEM